MASEETGGDVRPLAQRMRTLIIGGVLAAALGAIVWLRPGEVSVEGSQPIGGGKVLQILLEKDEARLGRDSGGDDSVA